jgi:hypothetical protein
MKYPNDKEVDAVDLVTHAMKTVTLPDLYSNQSLKLAEQEIRRIVMTGMCEDDEAKLLNIIADWYALTGNQDCNGDQIKL